MSRVSLNFFCKNDFLTHLFYLIAFFPLLDYGISASLLGFFIVTNLFINGIRITSIWLFSAFFFYLCFISLLNSSFHETVGRLSSSFLLIIAPITISSIKFKTRSLRKFSRIYVGVIVFKSIICLVLISLNNNFVMGGEIPVLNIQVHGTYFSYEILCATLLVHYFIESKHKMILLVFLTIVIVLFQKKIALIAIILFWTFHIKKNKRSYLLLLIPIVTLILYFKTEHLEKIKRLINTSSKLNLVGEDRVRIKLLEAGWQNFIEAPYFGKGVVEHTLFFSEYNLNYLGNWAEHMNTHNYFLFVLCSGGLLAFFLFICPYFYFMIKTFKRCKVFFIFLLITLLINLTESLFDRYSGAITFVLFSFIFHHYYSKTIKTQQTCHLKNSPQKP